VAGRRVLELAAAPVLPQAADGDGDADLLLAELDGQR
jgi:hypothetical protein